MFSASRLCRVSAQPLAKCLVERCSARRSHLACLFNEILIGAQSYIFHAKTVYTVFVWVYNVSIDELRAVRVGIGNLGEPVFVNGMRKQLPSTEA